MAILCGRLVLTNRYCLHNIIQLSIQRSGKHSFLAEFREYTCFFYFKNAKFEINCDRLWEIRASGAKTKLKI